MQAYMYFKARAFILSAAVSHESSRTLSFTYLYHFIILWLCSSLFVSVRMYVAQLHVTQFWLVCPGVWPLFIKQAYIHVYARVHATCVVYVVLHMTASATEACSKFWIRIFTKMRQYKTTQRIINFYYDHIVVEFKSNKLSAQQSETTYFQ